MNKYWNGSQRFILSILAICVVGASACASRPEPLLMGMEEGFQRSLNEYLEYERTGNCLEQHSRLLDGMRDAYSPESFCELKHEIQPFQVLLFEPYISPDFEYLGAGCGVIRSDFGGGKQKVDLMLEARKEYGEWFFGEFLVSIEFGAGPLPCDGD